MQIIRNYLNRLVELLLPDFQPAQVRHVQCEFRFPAKIHN